MSGKYDPFSLYTSLSPVRRVRQELKSSKNTTFCTRYLNFTAHLKSSLVFCINIGQYLFKGRNYTENGPNGVELWLKTFSFWLDLRPTRRPKTRSGSGIGPPDPKISIFRPPPILIFISLMVSLGVGKSQTDEVSFKSARISP